MNKCVVDLARSIADPFSYSSCIPDGSKHKAPFTVHQIGILQTGTTGTCYGIALGLQPDGLMYLDNNGTTSTARVVNANWSAADRVNNIGTQFTQYRIVSAGLRLFYTGSTLNDQGIIAFGTMGSESLVTAFNGQDVGQMTQQSSSFKIVPLRSGGGITWRPEDTNASADFYDVSTTALPVITHTDHSWLYAWVFGAANNGQSSVEYELVVNYEGYIGTTSFAPGGVGIGQNAQEVAVPGWYEQTLNMVGNVSQYVPNIISGMRQANDVRNLWNASNSLASGAQVRRLLSMAQVS